ncbi:MAG: hypothetical protein M9927_19995 [Anaerolineae bacterium]|nr:hypothetical protein [Anaerolineae bacterium]
MIWGADRKGSNEEGNEWKYIPVRRTALFIEESLFRGLKWVVFEPNDEPLWASIRLNAGAFMQNLFRQARSRAAHAQAYFVKCDQGDHHAERHQPWHCQHRGGLCTAEAC